MTDTPHLLVVMGSGETTPTMVTPHQQLLARLGDAPDAVLLDTPYGFQENADDITARTVAYFARNVGADVRPVRLPRPSDADELDVEAAQAAVADADWVFVGPGSPTYLLRQLATTRLPEVLRRRMRTPSGVTVVSSAAAVTVGSHAVPVYEVYKVGQDPHWVPGLGLLQEVGLDAVLVPHYDNAEGGGHDTRYCYLGATRLARLQAELPDGTWVLGVDEHTALVADLASGDVEVLGRGAVVVRRADGSEQRVEAGERTTLAELQRLGTSVADGAAAPAPAAAAAPVDGAGTAAADDAGAGGGSGEEPLTAALEDARAGFAAAVADGDAGAATRVVLELEGLVRAWAADTLTGGALDDAVAGLRGMITRLGQHADGGLVDPRERAAPWVELLLELRASARAAGDYATGDAVRDGLVGLGVEVRDTPDGSEWSLAG